MSIYIQSVEKRLRRDMTNLKKVKHETKENTEKELSLEKMQNIAGDITEDIVKKSLERKEKRGWKEKMRKEKKPSEFIQEFLDFLKYCDKEYKECVTQVYKYDKMNQDYLHDIEFAHNYKERCKLATRAHKQRNERRVMKDRVAFVEKVAKFCSDKQNKPFIDRLKSLLEEQEKSENYVLSERHYNRRGGVPDDSD